MYQELEALRLHGMSFSYRDIAKTVGMSKTWVGDLIRKCKKAGIGFEEARGMSRTALLSLLGDGKTGEGRTGNVAPVFQEAVPGQAAMTGPDVPSSLLTVRLTEPAPSSEEDSTGASEEEDPWLQYTKMKIGGVMPTRQFIYDNIYSVGQEKPLSYSQFCRNYQKALAAGGQKPIMHQEQIPARILYIDWAGDTITTTFSTAPKTPTKVYFFLTVLGAGSLPYLEGFDSMGQTSWNQGHLNAFSYYGGLPAILVPDNTKTAIIYRRMYDTEMNHSYLEMAWKYQLAIQPARIRRPTDKASVESGVGFIERNLLMKIRLELKDHQFESLTALNIRIRELLEKYSSQPFQKRPGSRMSVFQEIDRPALRPLPRDKAELFETREIKAIPRDYLVEYDGFYYSVPHRYIGRGAYVHAYKNKIEVVLKETRELIAFHPRHREGSTTVITLEHMPENHRAFYEFQHTDGNDYRKMAQDKGRYVHTLICDLLQSGPAEAHMYKECQGVLKLGEKYGDAKLNSACRKALEAYSVSYSTVKTILEGGPSAGINGPGAGQPAQGSSDHENIRKDWR